MFLQILKSKCHKFMSFKIFHAPATATAKSLQSCPALCDPIDGSPPGFPVPGILQARTLEWVAISFSNAWKWKVKVKLLSRIQLLATPWTAAHQAFPSMDFPGKSTGVGCHCLLCPWSYGQLIYDNGGKNMQCDRTVSEKWIWENWTLCMHA